LSYNKLPLYLPVFTKNGNNSIIHSCKYLDFAEARDSVWQWHQLGHMQICTSPQTDNHDSTPPLSFFTGWMPFLLPNQQRQSTEGSRFSGLWLLMYRQADGTPACDG